MANAAINAERLFAKEAKAVEAIAGAKTAKAVIRDRWVRCIDEGTPGGLHLAGSGILLGGDWNDSLERAARVVREMDADGITWHRRCGAVAEFVKLHPETGLDTDAAARRFAEELSLKVALPCREEELARPSEIHIARALYFDGTGRFDPSRIGIRARLNSEAKRAEADPSRVDGLPTGFVVSRRYLDETYALREVAMAVGIALGHHGFGELFTRERPFLLVAVGGDGKLKSELKEVAKPFGDRVAVVAIK